MARWLSLGQRSTSRLLKTTILFLLPDAATAQTVVVGCQDPAIDVDAIQAAVDEGGSVLLQGTFDFGDDGCVLLQRDVAINGEADASGSPITTIIGGDRPFFAPAPADMLSAPRGPMISVERIHFRQPSGVAIHLLYTGGAYIRGNKVTEIQRRPFSTFVRHAAVLVGPRDALVTNTISPRLVTGSIVVIENEVHMTDQDPTISPGISVFVHPTDGADIYVARNPTMNCARSCLDCGRLRVA